MFGMLPDYRACDSGQNNLGVWFACIKVENHNDISLFLSVWLVIILSEIIFDQSLFSRNWAKCQSFCETSCKYNLIYPAVKLQFKNIFVGRKQHWESPNRESHAFRKMSGNVYFRCLFSSVTALGLGPCDTWLKQTSITALPWLINVCNNVAPQRILSASSLTCNGIGFLKIW